MIRLSICFLLLIHTLAYAGPSEPRPSVQQETCKNQLVRLPATSKIPFGGYGFLVGIMTASAAATTAITLGVNPNAEFLPTFVSYILGQVTFVTASLYSAQLEPLSNWLRKMAYAINQKPQASESLGDLERLVQRVNALYTLRDQHATDRIMTFRLALKQNMEAAARAMESGDAESIHAQIVDILRMGYRLFREIDPSDPTIISAVRTSFLRKIADPSALYDPILSLLKKEDADFFVTSTNPQDLSPQAYYEKALKAWLLNPIPATNPKEFL